MISQIQRERKLRARYGRLDAHVARRMADPEESGKAPAFCLEGVHGECLMAAAARMHDMVSTSPCRSLHPGVDYIECQRRVNTDCRVQGGPRLPGAEANTGDKLPFASRRPQRNGVAVASHRVAIRHEAADLDLDALERRIDIPHRAAGDALLTHDVPGLERLAQLEQGALHGDVAQHGETKLEVRRKPFDTHVEAGKPLLPNDIRKILENEMRQQPPVMELRSPTRQLLRGIWLGPEAGYE